MEEKNINNILISAGISIGTYGFYKFIQNLYHKYYLKSVCHEKSVELIIVDRLEETKEIECKTKDKTIEIV